MRRSGRRAPRRVEDLGTPQPTKSTSRLPREAQELETFTLDFVRSPINGPRPAVGELCEHPPDVAPRRSPPERWRAARFAVMPGSPLPLLPEGGLPGPGKGEELTAVGAKAQGEVLRVGFVAERPVAGSHRVAPAFGAQRSRRPTHASGPSVDDEIHLASVHAPVGHPQGRNRGHRQVRRQHAVQGAHQQPLLPRRKVQRKPPARSSRTCPDAPSPNSSSRIISRPGAGVPLVAFTGSAPSATTPPPRPATGRAGSPTPSAARVVHGGQHHHAHGQPVQRAAPRRHIGPPPAPDRPIGEVASGGEQALRASL